mmetsp:Transcript_8352/g.18981  ORF Transcript_8352/g.18981 Transcript_8352/m.18981 type:complete len:547 (-) Transcript_8352:129-1769(-)
MSEANRDPNLKPICNLVNPLLTDMYQITMCYAYFRTKRHDTHAVFDLFFRQNPFDGEYTIFAGLSEVIAFMSNYRFTDEHIEYLKVQIPDATDEFFDYLKSLDCSQVKIYAFKEGSVVFPREPLLRVEGPVGICQLLETTLLCIVNYASLVATNAARMRMAVGPNKTLLEFGLRRSQGPDGGVSASRYSYIGGFDGTSNALAGMLFGMKVGGTHAHSFVQSFSSLDDLTTRLIELPGREETVDLVDIVLKYRAQLEWEHTNSGELAAFISYCQAFPHSFLALVDTYDTLVSGIPNFLLCALAMYEVGYIPIGIRLDSGDLAYLSLEARKMFREIEARFNIKGMVQQLKIVASNDISEETLYSLNQQGNSIDTFGIGTHLVTCQNYPALGCVYKMVEFDGLPRIKLSQEIKKVSIPGKKRIYRLFGRAGFPLVDLLLLEEEVKSHGEPKQGERVMCRHPLDPTKRVICVPNSVVELLELVWDGKPTQDPPCPSIAEVRGQAMKELNNLRHDHVRFLNPTPYKVSLSEDLFTMMHELWRTEAPIAELT